MQHYELAENWRDIALKQGLRIDHNGFRPKARHLYLDLNQGCIAIKPDKNVIDKILILANSSGEDNAILSLVARNEDLEAFMKTERDGLYFDRSYYARKENMTTFRDFMKLLDKAVDVS